MLVGSLTADVSCGLVPSWPPVADSTTLVIFRWTHTSQLFSSLERHVSEMRRWFLLKVPLSFAQFDFRLFISNYQCHLASVPLGLLHAPHHIKFSTSHHADSLGLCIQKMLEYGAAWPQ